MTSEVLAWPPVVAFRQAVEDRLIAKRDVPRSAFACPVTDALDALALEPVPRDFVWACVVAAVDPLMYPHLVTLGGVDARRGLSPATYAAIIGLDEREAIGLSHWLGGDPAIVRLGLLARGIPGLLAIATPYRASARLVGNFAGDTRFDGLVARLGGFVESPPVVCRDVAQAAALAHLRRALASGALVIVEGPPGVGRRTAVASCAAELGKLAIAIDAARLRAGELDEAVRALCADSVLRGAVPVVADLDRISGGEPGECAAILARVLDDMPGACAVTTSTPGLELAVGRTIHRVSIQTGDVATRLALWQNALGDTALPLDELRDIALRHKLGAGAINLAAHGARVAAGERPIDREAIVSGIRDTLADRFGSLVERLPVTDQWDDIVLSPETRDQLQALIARVRHAWTVFEDWRFPRQTARGGGVAALLSGPPGTGKSMVAGIIARELGRELYRVDLSQVISKWVGETEKQLGQVFDAAESGNALVLFDEADALFARRTEVKSSSDRYANLEVNYLLQRIETFTGITILTTNLDTSIDPALRRRLAAHVVFWPPEHDERATLWERFLRTRAPVSSSIDFDELASEYPDMTGANIRNAALAAAFLAAGANTEIDQGLVRRAARAEYRAMGRVLSGRK
jgi:MoxR-like ATPase